MIAAQVVERLARCTEPCGPVVLVLRIGGFGIRLEGLDEALAAALGRRWGAFLGPPEDTGTEPSIRVGLHRAVGGLWIEPRPGETYRVEGASTHRGPLVWSYRFAASAASPAGDRWLAAVSDSPGERSERVVDNLTRYLVARRAVTDGGFALHGAGVLREGRAWIFAGTSGAGKTTAVELSAPAASLGDDFAFVVPRAGGWVSAAVPFDNRERISEKPPHGWIPVAGIWRLYKDDAVRVEQPLAARTGASLMGCTAFTNAMPDLATSVVEAVGRFAGEGLHRHLHFAPRLDFWGPLRVSARLV